ncbi:mannose-6-phosphate isomerase, class I [Timonella senegalensis]|uniref:mannose-6-phosphate isomerase, class I n=1 Tax=Timonella senegalensis TaxID=1465825 RepID=UPI0028AFEDA5|nr:mannose-6-phosphate isomerase, class I [Timonella senegalensis]
MDRVVRQTMYRLSNTLHEYDWGSREAIFSKFGWEETGRPGAELWLGAHPLSPSSARSLELVGPAWQDFHLASETIDDSAGVSLISLIKSDPLFMLGEAVEEAFGPRLPYLLKILAANAPLSLQVHPKPHIARAGFARENASGLDIHSPERNYKDDQHKPEMILALTPFEGLAGFRRPARVLDLLDSVVGETAGSMRAVLQSAPNATGVRAALEMALALRGTNCEAELSETRDSIAKIVAEREALGERVSRGHYTALDLFARYPSDPGALVSLLLNRFSLEPGQAVYLESGQIHAYLHGLGVEVMASSDNVLRAGLTPKRVDIPELLHCTDFAPAPASRPTLRTGTGGLTEYRPGIDEFALLYGRVSGSALITHNGPRVLVALNGLVHVTSALGSLGVVNQGQSVFIPHGVGNIALHGDCEAVVAFVP